MYDLDSGRFTGSDAGETLAEALGWVAAVNAQLDAEQDLTGGVIEKLREWIEKLVETVRRLAKEEVEAQSCSITVGTHVSVSITFGTVQT